MTYDVSNPDNEVYNERDRLQRELDALRAEHGACAGRPVVYARPDGAADDEDDDARYAAFLARQDGDRGPVDPLNLNELKHLRRQVRDLQGRCGELLAQRRGIRYLVHDFHAKFGYAVRTTPTVPADDEVRFRLRLIAEEFFEVLGDALAPDHRLDLARSFVKKAIDGEDGGPEGAVVQVNLVSFADNMGDLDYVVEGTRLTFGIDGWPVLCEIQRANMDKTNEALSAADAAKAAGTTKAQKPEGWRPPDIEGELRKQGWNDAP